MKFRYRSNATIYSLSDLIYFSWYKDNLVCQIRQFEMGSILTKYKAQVIDSNSK